MSEAVEKRIEAVLTSYKQGQKSLEAAKSELRDLIEKSKSEGAVETGRRGGLANRGKTSDEKAKAARDNGKRGGRPPAFCPVCNFPFGICVDCKCEVKGCSSKPTKMVDGSAFCRMHDLEDLR